jgi:hypothetical protein
MIRRGGNAGITPGPRMSCEAYSFQIKGGRAAYSTKLEFPVMIGTIPLLLRGKIDVKLTDFTASGIYTPKLTPRYHNLALDGKGAVSVLAALGNEVDGGILRVAAWSYAAFSTSFTISMPQMPRIDKNELKLSLRDPFVALGISVTAESKMLQWKKDVDHVLIKPLENRDFSVPAPLLLPAT